MPDFPNLEVGGTGFKLNDIYTDISPQALGQLVDYITQSGIPVPVSQIVGFQQFTVQAASPVGVETNETTTSTSYTDLTTVGPQLTGLSDGKYLVMFGAVAKGNAAGNSAYMSPSVNSATPADGDSAKTDISSGFVGVSRALTVTLSGGNNSIAMKYKTQSAGTAGFQTRWLLVLRYANK